MARPLKRARSDKADEVKESQFVNDLMDMDEAQTEADFRASWKRKEPPNINPVKDKLIFQQIDMDSYQGAPLKGMPGSKVGPVPIMQMFGVTQEGNSVLAHVHGFAPYFFCTTPAGFTEDHCAEVLSKLNTAVLGQLKGSDGVTCAVLAIELVQKESIFGYHENRKVPFLQVTVTQHRFISKAKMILENGMNTSLGVSVYECYETNVEYILRFMVDTAVIGCNWIELPAGKYRKRPKSNFQSLCQIEVDVAYDVFISHPAEGEWSKIAPLRVLSFDIECSGRKGVFPEPDMDPVIQIGNMVSIQGESKPFVRNIFTLGGCANIAGSQVLSFEREQDLLHAWSEFIREVDCDMVTGFNIMDFDFPYLMNRAKHLKCTKFPYLGRLKNHLTKLTDANFNSKAYGARESKDINLDGRLKFDVLPILRRDYKLRSYTLNAVSAHFLNEQKEDVHHSIISDLQNGDDQTRRRLAVYCLKDSYLPLRLLEKLMCVYNYMEMARVTGVPFRYLLARGQQIKVISQLLRRSRQQDLVIPVYQKQGGGEGGVEYEGATVIEPVRGYYDVPISTLDFASLYPSIMMAHNLCYTTLLPNKKVRDTINPDDVTRTPTDDYFVKPTLRKGLLPAILQDLLTARKKAKKDLKAETDPFKRAVLDGRQLALKISANSVYGFTGATVGRLPCLQISASTTAFGREMIEHTKQMVETTYSITNGYSHDAQVIYGDTDSVMIKFGCSDMTEVMKRSEEAAALVTKTFIAPIKLEFEKVYFPYLLINKKRYAGLYWTQPTKWDKMDAKGIVTVRRDNCPLVVTLINTCLRKLLIERDRQGAIDYAKGIISDLLCNRVDISQLVITKALSKKEDGYENKQAHVELWKRMLKRDAGSAPSLGDRVPYVIIQGAKGARAFEKSEDPIYVLDNNIPLDTTYYLENQLSKPLLSIFDPILGENKARSQLLAGDHTLVVKKASGSRGGPSSGLFKFTKTKASCMSCKTILEPGCVNLCDRCKPDESKLYQKEVGKLTALEEKFSRLWSQCQRCQGSLHQDVLCTSSDCPIYYMRKKVQKDLKDQDTIVQKFGDTW
eukprot:m.132040 g.132040  ORF g.132040 m.132040 type:complete len:1070 (+) comp29583_c0_seq1:139-3348(+)